MLSGCDGIIKYLFPKPLQEENEEMQMQRKTETEYTREQAEREIYLRGLEEEIRENEEEIEEEKRKKSEEELEKLRKRIEGQG